MQPLAPEVHLRTSGPLRPPGGYGCGSGYGGKGYTVARELETNSETTKQAMRLGTKLARLPTWRSVLEKNRWWNKEQVFPGKVERARSRANVLVVVGDPWIPKFTTKPRDRIKHEHGQSMPQKNRCRYGRPRSRLARKTTPLVMSATMRTGTCVGGLRRKAMLRAFQKVRKVADILTFFAPHALARE